MNATHWCWRTCCGASLAILCALGSPLAAGAASPPAAAPVLAGPEADALCIAVLKQDVQAHLPELSGNEELSKALQHRVEAAFALSGEAYHQGISEKEARALLDVAEKTVATWPEPRRKAQVVRCETEGRERLSEASVLEKWVVRKGAQRWLQRERARLAS